MFSFRSKPKPYRTQADLIGMSAEEIVRLFPSEVSSNIKNITGDVRLTDKQRKAMDFLLTMKRLEKDFRRPLTVNEREQMIRMRFDPAVDNLIVDTNTSIMRDKVSMKLMENRNRRLNDRKEISLTPEEQVFANKVFAGRKTKRHRTNKRRTYKRTTKK